MPQMEMTAMMETPKPTRSKAVGSIPTVVMDHLITIVISMKPDYIRRKAPVILGMSLLMVIVQLTPLDGMDLFLLVEPQDTISKIMIHARLVEFVVSQLDQLTIPEPKNVDKLIVIQEQNHFWRSYAYHAFFHHFKLNWLYRWD